MGSFVEQIIVEKKIYKRSEIEKHYSNFNIIDDFFSDLINYFYCKIDNKKMVSGIEIDNFNTYLDKYFNSVSNKRDICVKLEELCNRIIEIKSSKSKDESRILKDFSIKLKEFLNFESYDSKKYDLEQAEIGNVLDDIIFEQNNEFIFELIKKSSKLCKYKYKNGELLISKVYSHFKNLVKDNDECVQLISFFQRLIFSILASDSYRNSSKIKEIISDLRDFKKSLCTSRKTKMVLLLIDNLEVIDRDFITKKERDICVKHLLSNYGIRNNFSSDIEDINQLVSSRTTDIRDFRDKNIITMDFKFKSAYDDAISLEKIAGGYLFGIYITDVASFVGIDTLLYEHAKQRSESIYTSEDNDNFYIPMFPIDITRDFFSLNRGYDRQVVAYLFKFSDDFDLISYEFTNAIINVKNNYSFDGVDGLKCSDSNYDMIDLLIKLTDVLGKNFNKNYHLIKEKNDCKRSNSKYSTSIGSKIISTSTLFLNSFVAEMFQKYEWPYIYRVNETNISVGRLHFSDLDDELKKCHVSRYSSYPLGHTVNNNKVYGHITNPIRSYASYMNQYLFEYLFLDWDTISKKNKFVQYWRDVLPYIVDELNKRLIENKSFVSVIQELNAKRFSK